MPWLIGSRNMSQMVNCILSFLLIIVKNNKTTGVKNEKVEWIKLKYPAPISPQKRLTISMNFIATFEDNSSNTTFWPVVKLGQGT